MMTSQWKPGRTLLASAVAAVLIPIGLHAQAHVVSPDELQKAILAISETREHNRDTLRHLLSTPEAKEAMRSAGIDAHQVTEAIAQLNDKELADLAARADKVQSDFVAGDMDPTQITFLVLALLVVAFLVWLAVSLHTNHTASF